MVGWLVVERCFVPSAEGGQLGLGGFDQVVGMGEPSISTPPELRIALANGVADTSSQINSPCLHSWNCSMMPGGAGPSSARVRQRVCGVVTPSG
jgi:hypothetical protein